MSTRPLGSGHSGSSATGSRTSSRTRPILAKDFGLLPKACRRCAPLTSLWGMWSKSLRGISNMTVMEDREKFRKKITEFNENFRYEDWPAGWEPSARLKDMDRDGVEAAVFFSSPTRFNYSQNDGKLQRAIFRSYNAWLLDFCNYQRKRLIPVPLISILDIELAVADFKEYARAGCRAVQLPSTISGSGYYESCYEPLWQTAQDLDLLLAIHSGTGQGQKRKKVGEVRQDDIRARVIDMNRPLPAVSFISNLIFSGVFARYPNLKVMCTEFDEIGR